MDDPKLSRGLETIASENISDRQDIGPKVRARLADVQPASRAGLRSRLWLAAAVVAAALGLVSVFVPPVRAGFIELIENIGGITFNLTADYPVGDSQPTIVPSETLPLAEVLADYEFNYPAWSPEGYVLDGAVQVTWFDWDYDQPLIELTWRGPEPMPITLAIHPVTEEIVGLTGIETIVEDGQEFALWRGGWNYDTKTWDKTISVQTLSWAAGGLSYDLQAHPSMPADWLVAMAKSSLP